MSDLLYKIAFTLIPGLGCISHRKLLDHFGSAEAIFQESPTALKALFGKKLNTIQAVKGKEMFSLAEKEVAFIQKHNIQPLFLLDDNFPKRLLQSECVDTPVLLYYKGKADLNNTKVISIVGTRKSTRYGQEVVDQLMKDLAPENALIVSGLAYGIDTCAHKSSLENGLPTVAVLAHGLDMIYPLANKDLAKQMLASGGLISEHTSGSKPVPGVFPRRNRIIAALSDATIVVEASKKGGALITAEIANSYNREVFAVPGRVTDSTSEGCNFLIKNNKAGIFHSASDIQTALNWGGEKSRKIVQQSLFPPDLSAKENKIYQKIKENNPCGIDVLCSSLDENPSDVIATLLQMELNGIIACLPGKMYTIA